MGSINNRIMDTQCILSPVRRVIDGAPPCHPVCSVFNERERVLTAGVGWDKEAERGALVRESAEMREVLLIDVTGQDAIMQGGIDK